MLLSGLELCSPRSWKFLYFNNKICFKRIYCQLVSVLRQSCVELIDTGTHFKEILNICASWQAREKLGWLRSPGAACVFFFSSPSSSRCHHHHHYHLPSPFTSFFVHFDNIRPFHPLLILYLWQVLVWYLYLWVKKFFFFKDSTYKWYHSVFVIVWFLSSFSLVLPPLSASSFFLYVVFINYPNQMTCYKGIGLCSRCHTSAAAGTTSGDCQEPQLASLKFTFLNFILRRWLLKVSSAKFLKCHNQE